MLFTKIGCISKCFAKPRNYCTVAGTVDQGILDNRVEGPDVIGAGRPEGAETQIEGDAPLGRLGVLVEGRRAGGRAEGLGQGGLPTSGVAEMMQ